MKAYVILNPYANRWKAKEKLPEVKHALESAHLDYELVETQGPGHAIQLATAAVLAGYSPIIAAGGDGTFGEVVNGLYRAQEDVLGPFGILPLGTANDLAINLKLPTTLMEASGAISHGKTRRIDLGKANEWVFDNNSAVGLEPIVTKYNISMTWLKGVIRYLVAAFRAIAVQPEWTMSLQWDDGQYEGPVSLVSVGNNPVTGGIFTMTPDADPEDGLLTFVFGYAPTRRKMLRLLPRAISGEYVNDPSIQQIHTKRLTILCTPPTPIQVDGEIRHDSLTHITYEVVPGKLDILIP